VSYVLFPTLAKLPKEHCLSTWFCWGVLTVARSAGTVAAQKQTLAWIDRNAREFDIIGTFCSAKYRRAAVNRLVALLQQFWKFVDLFGPRVLGLTGGALRDRLVHQSRDIAWRQQCVGGSAPMLRRRQRGPAGALTSSMSSQPGGSTSGCARCHGRHAGWRLAWNALSCQQDAQSIGSRSGSFLR
jgi:hypothetical protein